MAQSPTAGTVNFTGQVTTNLPVTASIGYATYRSDATTQATGQGFEFAMKGTAAASLQINNNTTTSTNLTFTRSATGVNITEVRIRSAATSSTTRDNDALLNTPGGQFDLVTMQVMLVDAPATSVTLTYAGYKDGVLQGTYTPAAVTSATTFATVTFPATFNDVDDILITGFGTGTGTNAGQAGIRIDNIVTTNAVPTFYYNTPQILTAGTLITSLSPFQTSNGTFTYTISPTLPGGLSFNTGTGVISGTPTAGTTSAATNYTVTSTNSAGSSTSIVNIAVVSAASTVVDANTATNTMPENSTIGTTVGLTAYSYPANSTTNIAAGKTATATSLENGTFLASYTTDGATTGNRWSSGYYDTQDLTIDLLANYPIGGVNLYWEVALGKDFQIQVSTDNITYTTIKSVYNNTTFNNVFTNLAGGGISTIGRYVRIHGLNRGTQYGYSLYEVQVYQALPVTYSFTAGGNVGSLYAINSTTGVVTVNNAAIDYETATSRSVTIQQTDGVTTTNSTFSIAITNVNEAPVITSNGGPPTGTISVAENTTAVTTVTATDVDAGDTKTYTKTGADAAKFTLTTGGVLTFTAAPDFETPGSAAASNVYTVVVNVADAAGLTSSQTLTVNVTNVNEAPVITSNGAGATASISVAENATAVTTVTATDVDAGDTKTYTKTGADAAKFTLTTGGVLTFTTAPDFEVPGSAAASNAYTVVVTVTDAAGLNDSQTLTVNVTNVNEAPVITSNGGGATASISVVENTTAVTTVVATDVDAGDTKAYSISGADAGKFTITTGGILTFTSPPNFASLGSAAGSNAYTVIVTVTDAGGLTDPQTLTVNVTNTGFLSPYAYRIPLTLNTVTAATTYTIGSNQANFPVLVRISDPSLVYSSTSCTNKVQFPNGPAYDFAFTTNTSSTELNYQVENYDQVNGVLLVWVQVPSLTYQSNNNLYFYFGSATSTAATHTTTFYQNTWPSDYKAVFHFNETTYTGTVTDGTIGALHTATTVGMSSGDLIAGKIGTAYSFDGSTKSIVSNAVTITGAFTLSAWVYMTDANRDQKIMTNQATNGSSTGGYKLGVYSDNTAEVESASAGNRGSTPAAPTFATGGWHYVQGVYTGSSLFNYIDGQPYKVFTTGVNPSATTPLYIGVGEGGATYWFAGTIDEPRVSNIAKSNDWIKFEYANQDNPTGFTTAGSLTTDATNVLTIPGGVIYTYTGGTYTVNVAGVSTTPANTGKESFIIASSVTVPATFNAYALTVNSGITLGLNGQTTNVGCNVTNNGTITYNSLNASTLNFNGTLAAQSYTGTSAIYSSVGALKINNTTSGAILNINGGPLDVYNLITLTAGSINVNSLATLTLKSSATQTAAVDIITSPTTNKITGYVNAERFLSGGGLAANRGYRLMSSPVNQSSATVASTNTFGLSYLKNHTYLNVTYLGAFTGGPSGTGFSGTNSTPTIYLYKETLTSSNFGFLTGKHVGISAITTSGSTTSTTTGTTATVTTTHSTDPPVTISIPIGNGFLFYFVGPSTRTTGSANFGGPPIDATITANGFLNQGTFTVNLWYTPTGGVGKLSNSASSIPGYNMMGNPYASTINLATVLSDNTASIDGIFMLGTKTGGTAQNYVAYSAGGTSSPTALGYAVSGAGFMVHVKSSAGTGATLTFNEAQKVPTQQITGTALIMSAPGADAMIVDRGNPGSGALHRSVMALPAQQGAQPLTGVYMKMEKDSLVYDYTGIYFRSDYKAKFEDGDLRYLSGPTATVSMASLSADGVNTAVNLMPDYHNGSRVKLNVSATNSGLYNLKIEGIRNIDTLYNIFLIDKLKKDSLDIRRYGAYAFNLVKTDTTTFGANRFELSIQRRPIVPFVLAAFAGNKVTGGVKLDWKTYNESNYTGFILEKQDSKTGQYVQIYERQSNGGGNYSFTDPAPNAGNNIYRLKENDIDGKISYSANVTVFYDKIGINGLFSVFPNPTAEVINVSVPDKQSSSTYKMRLYDTMGNLLLQRASNTSNWTENVSGLKPGAYIVEVVKSNGASLGKAKFIKR